MFRCAMLTTLIAAFIAMAARGIAEEKQQKRKIDPGIPVTLTAEQRKKIEKVVSRRLRDPESSKFTAVAASADTSGLITVCGLVNGKNAYGAYTGSEPFVAFVMHDKDTKEEFASFGRMGRDTHEKLAIIDVCKQYRSWPTAKD